MHISLDTSLQSLAVALLLSSPVRRVCTASLTDLPNVAVCDC